jgi:hypothetical protein
MKDKTRCRSCVFSPGDDIPVHVRLFRQFDDQRDSRGSRADPDKQSGPIHDGFWYQERSKNPSPITDEEKNEHMAPMLAESKQNAALPLPRHTVQRPG